MNREQLRDWIAAYERAWRTPGTESLADLFSEDATYSTAPYETAHRGLSAISEMWEAERRGPDEEFEMNSEIVAVEGETGVIRVAVGYGAPNKKDYRDLWIVRLDPSGRCSHFEEWPFSPPDQENAPARGAGL